MNKAVIEFTRSRVFRKTLRGLRLHRVSNWWLEHFPRKRVLPGSGVVYRARRTEGVSLAFEILEGGNDYDPSVLPAGYTTFADLGCNVGFFSCWLAHNAAGRKLKGIMIDANPGVVAESRWHAEANQWRDVHVLHGLVGIPDKNGSAAFYVHEANTLSTAHTSELDFHKIGKHETIQVPVINVGEEWRRRMNNSRCNVLKLDIEGCELDFLKAETEFMKLVDALYIEWHKNSVTFDDVNAVLISQGFKLGKIISEIGLNGMAFYTRN